MDLYQQRAAGMQAVAEPEEHQGAGHKIGLFGIFFLLACTLILDAISILDVFALDIPIADFIAGFFDILLLLYMTYKGILGVRNVVSILLTFVLELIPGVDWLPLYMIGIIAVIIIDRNDALSSIAQTAAKYVPQSAGKGGGVTKVAGRGAASKAGTTALSRQMQRNKLFGSASEQYLKKASDITKKLPGPLRSLPEDGPKGFKTPEKLGFRQVASAAKQAYQNAKSSEPRPSGDDDPFGAFDYENEQVPQELNQIMKIDVDGTRATAAPPPRPTRQAQDNAGQDDS